MSEDQRRIIVGDGYSAGDDLIYLWTEGGSERRLIYGVPLENRKGSVPPLNAIHDTQFTQSGLLFVTALFDDAYSLGYLDLPGGGAARAASTSGTVHEGEGELERPQHVARDRYTLTYNIDGASWVYEGAFHEDTLEMQLDRVLVGEEPLSNGVIHGMEYDKSSDSYALSF